MKDWATPSVLAHAVNPHGRDFCVGDIHGHFARLEQKLAQVRFDPEHDRLFSVGDLVDRGPSSARVLEWLDYPWFYAIMGNHEQMCISTYEERSIEWVRTHYVNGGMWFFALTREEKLQYVDAFRCLPAARTVQTPFGDVGIIHAQVYADDWRIAQPKLEQAAIDAESDLAVTTLWSRDKWLSKETDPVLGIEHVVVGHTPVKQPEQLGNVHYIDTAGWLEEGHFTLFNLTDFEYH